MASPRSPDMASENGHSTIEEGEKMAICKVGADGEDINDEDLFEIDLEMLNEIPPSKSNEVHPNVAGITLLANCLLPAVDVSGAVPITSDLGTTLETLLGRRDVDALPLVWGFHLLKDHMLKQMMNASAEDMPRSSSLHCDWLRDGKGEI